MILRKYVRTVLSQALVFEILSKAIFTSIDMLMYQFRIWMYNIRDSALAPIDRILCIMDIPTKVPKI